MPVSTFKPWLTAQTLALGDWGITPASPLSAQPCWNGDQLHRRAWCDDRSKTVRKEIFRPHFYCCHFSLVSWKKFLSAYLYHWEERMPRVCLPAHATHHPDLCPSARKPRAPKNGDGADPIRVSKLSPTWPWRTSQNSPVIYGPGGKRMHFGYPSSIWVPAEKWPQPQAWFPTDSARLICSPHFSSCSPPGVKRDMGPSATGLFARPSLPSSGDAAGAWSSWETWEPCPKSTVGAVVTGRHGHALSTHRRAQLSVHKPPLMQDQGVLTHSDTFNKYSWNSHALK